jgi:hypothetical protein
MPFFAGKTISIILRSDVQGTYSYNDWYVYFVPAGTSAICKPADQTVAKWNAPDGGWPSGPQWANGIHGVNVDGMSCEYKNDNTNAGALWCSGRNGAIPCYKSGTPGKYCDGGRIYHEPNVYCQW